MLYKWIVKVVVGLYKHLIEMRTTTPNDHHHLFGLFILSCSLTSQLIAIVPNYTNHQHGGGGGGPVLLLGPVCSSPSPLPPQIYHHYYLSPRLGHIEPLPCLHYLMIGSREGRSIVRGSRSPPHHRSVRLVCSGG